MPLRRTYGGRPTRIAVVDSGVNVFHAALEAAVADGSKIINYSGRVTGPSAARVREKVLASGGMDRRYRGKLASTGRVNFQKLLEIP
ncbi:MAG: hypothetical protein HY314_06745 [Acidobacteria bacterium]|nr:hypothetical protein [Acidobacteriota bacterium]